MTHKSPHRPKHDVTQPFNDGLVTIFSVSDDAVLPGLQPVEKLTPKVKLPYEERKLGIQRYYQAKQNQIAVERVLRVPKPSTAITSQDVAQTEDGKQYRIDLVQTVPGVFPPSLDLTLKTYSQGVT